MTRCIYNEKQEGGQAVADRAAVMTEKDSEEIWVCIDTAAKVTKTDKRPAVAYESWQGKWGAEPSATAHSPAVGGENAPDYIYLYWTVRTDLKATQPFDFTLADAFDVPYNEVVAYRMPGNALYASGAYTSGGFIPASVEGANVSHGMTLSRGSETRTDYVITRLEKQYYDQILEAQDS